MCGSTPSGSVRPSRGDHVWLFTLRSKGFHRLELDGIPAGSHAGDSLAGVSLQLTPCARRGTSRCQHEARPLTPSRSERPKRVSSWGRGHLAVADEERPSASRSSATISTDAAVLPSISTISVEVGDVKSSGSRRREFASSSRRVSLYCHH